MTPTPENEDNKTPQTEPEAEVNTEETSSEAENAESPKENPPKEEDTTKNGETPPKAEESAPKDEEDKGKNPETADKDPEKTGETPEKQGLSQGVPNEAKVEPKKTTAQEMEELKNVTVDTAFANNSFKTLGSISFDDLIGNPLRAAVKAQRDMAKEALNYIKDEGIKVDKNGNAQLTYVTLNFVKDGKPSKMQIPLLTLIPYPSLSISSMTYKFTATIDASSRAAVAVGCDIPAISTEDSKKSQAKGSAAATPAANSQNESKSTGSTTPATSAATQAATQAAASLNKASENKSMAASYSSKRDSSATRDSRYSVETTIDLTITATNQDPPSGITRIMEELNKSTEVISSDGELQISAEQLTLTNGYAVLSASYRNGEGVYKREEIKCSPLDKGKLPTTLANGDDVLFLFSEKGTYTVKAGVFQRVVFVS